MDQHNRPTIAWDLVLLLIKSQLADPDSARKLHDRFCEEMPDSIGMEQELAAFCSLIMKTGKLTRWQCEMLCDGKWKGFFQGGYELRQFIETDGDAKCYFARNTSTGQMSRLRVSRDDESCSGMRVEIDLM